MSLSLRPDLRQAGRVAGLVLIASGEPVTATHAQVGQRRFIETMLVEDPQNADQLMLPSFTYQRFQNDPDAPAMHQFDFGFELEKRITPGLSISVSDTYTIINQSGVKTRTGFQALQLGTKYEFYRDAEHDLLLTVGLLRSFGGTGAKTIEPEQTGVTQPFVEFGKGFDHLSIALLRPLAVTGQFGFAIADRNFKADPEASGALARPLPSTDTGLENRWLAGLTLQYSLSYLASEIRQAGLPDWTTGMTPVIEFTWSSPANSPSRTGTQFLFAPGLVWSNPVFSLGAEMLVPASRAAGRGLGAIAQFRIQLGAIAPALGLPVFGGR